MVIFQYVECGKRIGQSPKALARDDIGCLSCEFYIEAQCKCMGKIAMLSRREVRACLFLWFVASGMGSLLGWLYDPDINHALPASCKCLNRLCNILWDT